MLSYVFMGSPALAVTILEAVCDQYGPPKAVITQMAKAGGRGQKLLPTAVAQFAQTRGFPLMEVENVNAPEHVEALRAYSPDVVLVAAFGQILRQDILTLPKIACLNVHASLLPKYRGAAPFQRAIWNHDQVTGVTIQKMAKKLDAGDILLQKEIAILPTETSGELLDRLAKLGAVASIEALRLLESGKYTFVPQDETKATLAPKIDKADSHIDWNLPSQKIFDQIRALQPWPVAEAVLDGVVLRVFKAEINTAGSPLEPGAIRTDNKTRLEVGCGDKLPLSLTEIQLANRKRLGIRDFLLAYRGNFPHTRMGTHVGSDRT